MKRYLSLLALWLSSVQANAAPVTYEIDASHTMVMVSWNHLGFSNPSAHFGDARGKVVYDADNVAASSVKVTLPMSGLNAFSTVMTDLLKRYDLLYASSYPEATFESTKVEPLGDKRLRVTGWLYLKGVRKEVVLTAVINKVGRYPLGNASGIGLNASTTFQRSEFGVNSFIPMVSDEIAVQINLEAANTPP